MASIILVVCAEKAGFKNKHGCHLDEMHYFLNLNYVVIYISSGMDLFNYEMEQVGVRKC